MNTYGVRARSPQEVFETSRVNVPSEIGATYNPLYDYSAYPVAGARTTRFFLEAQGQGVGLAGGTKTLVDTNMTIGGMIPKGQMFNVTGVQVELLLNIALVALVTPPELDYALSNIAYTVYRQGALVMTIGQKNFIEQAPLMKFAPVNRMEVRDFGALSASTTETTTTIDNQLFGSYATAAGREFAVADLMLESSQNFDVSLLELPALPEGVTARIGVTLNGILYRNAQ